MLKCWGAQMLWQVMLKMLTVPQSWQQFLRLIRQASSFVFIAHMFEGHQLIS